MRRRLIQTIIIFALAGLGLAFREQIGAVIAEARSHFQSDTNDEADEETSGSPRLQEVNNAQELSGNVAGSGSGVAGAADGDRARRAVEGARERDQEP